MIDGSGDGSGDEPLDEEDALLRWGWKVVALATSLVIVASAVRGVRRGYELVGDNALIELRARDVLTEHHPFLGTWSSASISSSVDVNHPGPLLFDLLAAPVRLLGGATGTAITVAVLAVVVVWTVGFVTSRAAGPAAALVAQVVTAGIAWTVGSELLYDAWQPNVLVLPFWLLLCTVWAVVVDRVELLPVAVLVGSFCMQTHLAYLFLVPILLAFALGVVVLRRRPRGSGRFDDLWAPLRTTAIVGVVLWAQPVWEQLFGPGRGNLGRLLTAGTGGSSSSEATAHTGVSLGVRLFSSVLAQPPWWLRPGFDTSIPPSTWVDTPGGRVLSAPGLTGARPAVAALGALVGVVVVGWLVARRRPASRAVAQGYWVLALCAAVALVTLVITPIDVIGLTPHKIRYLWIIGAFATFLLLLTILSLLRPKARRVALVAVTALGLLAVVATVPFHASAGGPVELRASYESVGDLRSQLAEYFAHDRSAPDAVRFDASGIGFAEPYTSPVMAQLVESGVDLAVDDVALSRQLGPDRLADRSDAGRPLVYVRAGPAALEDVPGVERIAFYDGDRSPFNRLDVTDRAVAVFLSRDGEVHG
ncbi:MAG: hypothetical protein ACJ739_12750 [Acidimicrobiales bacterium]